MIKTIYFFLEKICDSGADPGFSFRGGAKYYMRERTLRARNPKSLSQGSRAHLRALEALGFF